MAMLMAGGVSAGGGGGAPEVTFTYASGGDTNGLLYWLGTNAGDRSFLNPSIDSSTTYPVVATALNVFSGWNATYVCDRLAPVKLYHSQNVNGSWFKLALDADLSFVLKGYALRNRGDFGNHHLKNYILEGSNNDTAWTEIHEYRSASWGTGVWQYFDLPSHGTPYRFFRIRQDGYSGTSGYYYLCCEEMEVYGELNVG
jgi:E3 ubiquitin-protein ligase HECTD1